MGHEILLTLRAALDSFVQILVQFLPRALSALMLLIFGWVLAGLLRLIVRKLLVWVRFDALLQRLGADGWFAPKGAPPPHRVASNAVYWLTWVGVVLAMLEALGVSGAAPLIGDFLRFLPRLVAAAAILVVGFTLSTLAWRASILAAVKYRLQAATVLGTLVRLLVIVTTVAMAFEEVGVGSGVVHTAFAISFGSVMFAAAIAFGLGGRHAARRYIEQRLLARGKDDDDGQSHL
jgi:Conserved TM helix